MSTHNPVARTWVCSGCGGDWPCATRRRELRAEFAGSRVSLGLYLGQYFVVAAEDLRHVPSGWLHNRFVGWIRADEQASPYTSVDVLVSSYELARAHSPDRDGRCPTCGEQTDCWVRISPEPPGLFVPLP